MCTRCWRWTNTIDRLKKSTRCTVVVPGVQASSVSTRCTWSTLQHLLDRRCWYRSYKKKGDVYHLLSELVSGSYLGGRTGEELLILDLTARPYSQLTGLTGLRELQRPWTLYSCLIQDETEDASWSALSPVILKNSLNFTVYSCVFLYILVYSCIFPLSTVHQFASMTELKSTLPVLLTLKGVQ